VTEPPLFRLTVAKVYGRAVRSPWFLCCGAVWLAGVAAGIAADIAGWHLPAGVRPTADLALYAQWTWVFATASTQYYREQPDADWSTSGNRVGKTAWAVGRRLAKVLPPPRDDGGGRLLR
jgi:hypothetical protein